IPLKCLKSRLFFCEFCFFLFYITLFLLMVTLLIGEFLALPFQIPFKLFEARCRCCHDDFRLIYMDIILPCPRPAGTITACTYCSNYDIVGEERLDSVSGENRGSEG